MESPKRRRLALLGREHLAIGTGDDYAVAWVCH
jgi:hypothetical protein